MRKLLLFILLISTVGCYQIGELAPVDEGLTENSLLCSKASVKGPFETFGTIDENLSQFFTKYVKAPNGNALPADLNYSSNLNYDTRFDYKGLHSVKKEEQTKALRNSILGHLNQLDLAALSKEEQIATLINAYNFVAVDIVIQNSCSRLISSIANLGGLLSFKAFSDTANFGYFIAGERVSLDTIEKEMIAELTDYEDARIHFAVICASGGCPVLLHKPFTGADLEAQLNFITRAGLRLPRMFHNRARSSYLSKIFDWYLDDFISDIARTEEFDTDQEFVQAFVQKYSSVGTIFNVKKIKYVKYDWFLNKL